MASVALATSSPARSPTREATRLQSVCCVAAERPASTAHCTGLKRVTTTLVDRLERAGYARRVRDTADRPRVVVELTPKLRAGVSPYEALFHGTVQLLENRTDALELMIDFLEQGRELVERELEKLERAAEDRAGS